MTDITVTEEPTAVSVTNEGVQVVVSDVGAQGPAGPAREVYPFTMQDDLEVVAGTTYIPFDDDVTIQSIQAVVSQPPTGQSVIVDVNLNGASVFAAPGDRPTIAVGQYVSGTVTGFASAITAGDRLSVDVDQIGSTQPGRDLVVLVRIQRN